LQEWRRKPRSGFSRKMLLFNTASRDTLWFTNFIIGPSTQGEWGRLPHKWAMGGKFPPPETTTLDDFEIMHEIWSFEKETEG